MNVKNTSSQEIVSIHVKGKLGTSEFLGVKKGQEGKFPVYHRGEGNYTVVFTMADGSTCESGSFYVESGYSTIEWVSDKGALNEMGKSLGHKPSQCVRENT
jgi:hypothetical protein